MQMSDTQMVFRLMQKATETQGNTWIWAWSTVLAVWNVLTLANTGQKKWEAQKWCSILDLLWMSRLWHLLNNEVLFGCLWNHLWLKRTSVDKVHIALYSTQEEKEHQSARLVSEQPSISDSGCSHQSQLWHLLHWMARMYSKRSELNHQCKKNTNHIHRFDLHVFYE